MGEDDVLFRIGFEDHPDSRSRLESLAKSVEETQARISKAVEATGARAIAQMVAVRSEATKPIVASALSSPATRSPMPTPRTGSGVGVVPEPSVDRSGSDSIIQDERRKWAEVSAIHRDHLESEKRFTDSLVDLSRERVAAMRGEAASTPEVDYGAMHSTRLNAERTFTQSLVDLSRERVAAMEAEADASRAITARINADRQSRSVPVERDEPSQPPLVAPRDPATTRPQPAVAPRESAPIRSDAESIVREERAKWAEVAAIRAAHLESDRKFTNELESLSRKRIATVRSEATATPQVDYASMYAARLNADQAFTQSLAELSRNRIATLQSEANASREIIARIATEAPNRPAPVVRDEPRQPATVSPVSPAPIQSDVDSVISEERRKWNEIQTLRNGFIANDQKFTESYAAHSRNRIAAIQAELEASRSLTAQMIADARARNASLGGLPTPAPMPMQSPVDTTAMEAAQAMGISQQQARQLMAEGRLTEAKSARLSIQEQINTATKAELEATRRIAAENQSLNSARQSVVNLPSPSLPAAEPTTAPTSGGNATPARESMVPIHRAEVEAIMREDARLRAELEANLSARAKAEQDYTSKSDAMSEVRRIAMEEEAAVIRAGVAQIQKDLELVSRANEAGGAKNIGVSETDVNNAKIRILKVYEAQVQAEEAATAIVLKEQKAREAANQQAARDAGLRVQAEIAAEKKAAEEGRKSLMQRLELYKKQKQEAKAAADATIREAERERSEAIKAIQAVAREREKMHKEAQASARAAATPLIDEYAKEERVATDAMNKIGQARGQLLESVLSSGEAVGKLARGAVLLGVAEGEEMEKVMKQLASVQAGIDIASGSIQIIRNIAKGLSAMRAITVATTAAKAAENAQTRIATASSAALKIALDVEALSATNAARAHAMLNAARSNKGGGAAGAVGNVASTVAATGARGGVRGIAGRVVGGAASLIGVGGMGGGSAAAATGTGAAAATGATAIATLGAAAAAAAVGLGMAGKGAYDLYQNIQRNGMRSNAEQGSYADTVGGSKWNPFSALIAWSERANLKQEEEQTARMEIMLEQGKMQAEHDKKMRDMEVDSLYERNKAAMNLELEFATERINQLRDPAAKRAESMSLVDSMRGEVSARQAAVRGFERTDPNSGLVSVDMEQSGAAQAVAALADAQERLKTVLDQRLTVEQELQDESRKTTVEQIRGIEEVIRARQEEKSALEDSLKSAKERFGELSAIEQAQAIKTLEKARAGQQLTRKDLSRLDQLGTDESKSFASQARIKSAEAAGFDRVDIGRNERLGITDKDKAINQGLDDLAAKSGQSRADLASRAATPKVEIVDSTQLNVMLNVQQDVLFAAITKEIDAVRRDMVADFERRAAADLAERQRTEAIAYEAATAPNRVR
jgi:hypothetical protein